MEVKTLSRIVALLGGVVAIIAVLMFASREDGVGYGRSLQNGSHGDHSLIAESPHPPDSAARAPITPTTHDDSQELPPDSGDFLFVHVLDGNSNPVPAAKVVLHSTDSNEELSSSFTHNEGIATLPLPPLSSFLLKATTIDGTGSLLVYAGTSQCTIRLKRSRTIQVLVEDQSRSAVDNVTVLIIEGDQYFDLGVTNVAGLTPAIYVPLEGTLVAEARGPEIERTQISFQGIEAGNPLTMTVTRLPIELTGTVYASGEPVVGAVVRDLENSVHEDTTKADGTFSLGKYADGTNVRILASHPDFLFATHSVSLNRTSPPTRIDLPDGWPRIVEVQDYRGQPIAKARVTARIRTGWAASLSTAPVNIRVEKDGDTDAMGRCPIKGLPEGAVDYVVTHPDFNTAAVRVVNHPSAITVLLTQRHDWHWRVEVPESVEELISGEGWMIVLTPNTEWAEEDSVGPPELRWVGKTDRTGRATIFRVPQGDYIAQIMSPNRHWQERFPIVVAVGGGLYEAPGEVARLALECEVAPQISLTNDRFRSSFFVDGTSYVCLCRPGTVVIQSQNSTSETEIAASGKSQWLDSVIRTSGSQ